MAAGWQKDPTGRHELRYHDGSRWTDNVSDRGQTSTDAYESRGTGAGVSSADVPLMKRSWVKWVAGGIIGLVVGVAIGGGTDTKTETTTETVAHVKTETQTRTVTRTKTKTVKAKATPAAPPSPPAAASNGPTSSLPLEDGDWRLDSINVKNDGLGNFGGTARITYTGSDAAGGENIFTVTLFQGGEVVGSLQGSAEDVKPGDTETVDMISQDHFKSGPYKYDFQKDI